jgi:hypothetical protein
MWFMSKKRRQARRRKTQRRIKGGEGAADHGVKVWGFDQVADPHQGNVIQTQSVTEKQTGGAAPYINTPPEAPTMNMADMQNSALQMQKSSVDQMTDNSPPPVIQSQSVTPHTGGKSKRRRRSKRKYRDTVKNGRRTKTIY